MRYDETTGVYAAIKNKMTKSADQAACPAGGVGAAAGAFDTSAHRDEMIALINEMRSALIEQGIIKGSA